MNTINTPLIIVSTVKMPLSLTYEHNKRTFEMATEFLPWVRKCFRLARCVCANETKACEQMSNAHAPQLLLEGQFVGGLCGVRGCLKDSREGSKEAPIDGCVCWSF